VVVVQEAIVQPLTGSSLAVDGLILFAVLGNAVMETEVMVYLYVYRAPIAALAAFGRADAPACPG